MLSRKCVEQKHAETQREKQKKVKKNIWGEEEKNKNQ